MISRKKTTAQPQVNTMSVRPSRSIGGRTSVHARGQFRRVSSYEPWRTTGADSSWPRSPSPETEWRRCRTSRSRLPAAIRRRGEYPESPAWRKSRSPSITFTCRSSRRPGWSTTTSCRGAFAIWGVRRRTRSSNSRSRVIREATPGPRFQGEDDATFPVTRRPVRGGPHSSPRTPRRAGRRTRGGRRPGRVRR